MDMERIAIAFCWTAFVALIAGVLFLVLFSMFTFPYIAIPIVLSLLIVFSLCYWRLK